MINPCKECIVTSMCRSACELLLSYLENSLIQAFIPDNHTYQYVAIAYQLRTGLIIEIDGAIKEAHNGKTVAYLSR